MRKHQLGYFIEDLWTKGFRLTDEDIRFIYFGKNSTNTPDWKVVLAMKTTLRFQQELDGSFFISILELLGDEAIDTTKDALLLLKEKGLAS
ncbi:DUF6123 family protein [Terrihalobacillus insolitus]|uniref:DUF6123 family protein n=1 Tax=Terrihalobacillus insolitus TaxID=2950438 RepID=UPI00234256D3|nr:DUF6123 family protein [Terrihalobacillus insolitus]MDC3413002.1 DUF6123 family protein [Terrihalobacillus insolitus]